MSGTVYSSNFSAVPDGASFKTSVSYNSSQVGTPIQPGFDLYTGLPGASMHIGSSVISQPQAEVSILYNFDESGNGSGPWIDAFDWVSTGTLGFTGRLAKELGSQSCSNCDAYTRLFFESPYPEALNSLSLPSPFPPLSEWSEATLQFAYYNPNNGQNLLAQGSVQLVKDPPSPSPESSGFVYLLTGSALLALGVGSPQAAILRKHTATVRR